MSMSNRTYDGLKIVALIILPLSELISAIANIWGLPYGAQITATLIALDAFLGSVLKLSSDKYHAGANDE